VDWQLLFFGLLALGAGIVALVGGVGRLRLWRLIARTPTSPAAAVAPGPVEVAGTVETDGPLERAPFSGADAAYGRWTIEELRQAGKSRKWRVVEQGPLGGAFRVRDGSGSVRVDPDGAEEDLEVTWSQESGQGRDPPPQVLRFLEARGVAFEGWFGINKRMRYRETLLVPGAQVYVLGMAGPDPSMRLAIGVGDQGFPFVLSSKAELAVLRGARRNGILSLLVGALFTGVGVFLLARSQAVL
jgi:hypothetical protein